MINWLFVFVKLAWFQNQWDLEVLQVLNIDCVEDSDSDWGEHETAKPKKGPSLREGPN